MKKLQPLLLLAVSLLLSACAVTVQPGGAIDVHAVGVQGGLVSERLGIRSYPGSTTISQEEKADSWKATFETSATFEAVYDHYHGQLARQGWQRDELERKSNKIEAEYRRAGEELELKLHREGRSGRYRLELKLND